MSSLPYDFVFLTKPKLRPGEIVHCFLAGGTGRTSATSLLHEVSSWKDGKVILKKKKSNFSHTNIFPLIFWITS